MRPQDNRREHRGRDFGHKGSPLNPNKSRPSGKWRENYDCKVNKGDHIFVLMKPSHIYRKEDTLLGVDEYYDKLEAEYNECVRKREESGNTLRCCWKGFYHFKCTACGKQHLSSKRDYGKK